MFEEKLTDDEIRELWAEGFPKRHDNLRANGLCELLRLTIEHRAIQMGATEQSIIFDVNRILDKIGIPARSYTSSSGKPRINRNVRPLHLLSR